MIEPTSAGVAGWLWEKYGANLLRTLGEKLQVGWTKMNWADHERKYSQHLLAEHSTTKLLGNPKEICLDEIYTDVYILDQISAFRRLDVEDMKKEQFNLRFQRATGQLENTGRITEVRRDIARLKTLATAKAAAKKA